MAERDAGRAGQYLASCALSAVQSISECLARIAPDLHRQRTTIELEMNSEALAVLIATTSVSEAIGSHLRARAPTGSARAMVGGHCGSRSLTDRAALYRYQVRFGPVST
jgi:hypothetical protein